MFWKKLFSWVSEAEVRVEALVAAASRIPPESNITAVVELGEQAIDPLLRALESKNNRVRSDVGHAIGLLGPVVIPRLTVALESASPGARKEIAGAIAKIGDPSTIPLLTKLLADPDKGVRRAVAQNLWFMKNPNPKVIEALVGALDRSDNGYQVLGDVAGSLVKHGWSPQTKEQEIMIDVLSLNPMYRPLPSGRTAVCKVTRHGKASIKYLLMALEEDENPSNAAREYAIDALQEIGTDESVLPALYDFVARVQKEDGYSRGLLNGAFNAIIRIKELSSASPRPNPSLGLDAPKSAMEEVIIKNDLYVGNIIRVWHGYLNQWATGWLLVEEFIGTQIVFWDYDANSCKIRSISDSIPCWRDPGSKNK